MNNGESVPADRLLDDELSYLLEAFGRVPCTLEELPAYRRAFDEAINTAPISTLGTVIVIPDVAGQPPVEVVYFKPEGTSKNVPAIVHMHAGGHIIGCAAMNNGSNQALATELKCAVFSVEYRLAPETRHPGPLLDCYRALKWIHSHSKELGIDPNRIGLKGESAGGGLAAALAIYARDQGEIPIAFQHLIYPMLDDRTGSAAGPDSHPHVGQYVWNAQQNQFGWQCLLGTLDGENSPLIAAAAREQDLTGLPPAFISVGALDLFLEECLEYARRLTRAGVAVELHVYPGAFHGFDAPPTRARVATFATEVSQRALRRALYS